MSYGDKRTYRQYANAFSQLPMPYAYLDLEYLRYNITDILNRSGQKQVRIASKSIRSVSVLRYILERDCRFSGVMCYSAQEAVCLAERGLDDLLIGYPVWNEESIRAICCLVKQGKTIVFMVDDVKHVDRIAYFAREEQVVLPVCLDIDMSTQLCGLYFGVRRSPVRSVGEAVTMAEYILSQPFIRLEGLMGYEAQIAGVGDHTPKQALKNMIITYLKRRSIEEIANKRLELAYELKKRDIHFRFFNGGGTGSLHSTCKEDVINEVTVGSGFYGPALFDSYRDFQCAPAAGYAIEIVRLPKEGVFTCHGGGYTGSGATGTDKLPQPYLPLGSRLLAQEGAGEVQTPIMYKGEERLQLGDPVFMRHSKAGELCERFKTLHCYEYGQITGQIKTYRGEGWCFV
ncbi:amino acid deaminase/aldolase [Paenibacillus sp. ACRRX]|uniref:amino acid deaminase/aldolase n=1 Tax=Paenibacillus sp. ACRRX TaxID=2918206 RepID=UPI001EF6CAF4|nr:amino acid deaminase/aldolase [Paenibacillus sp. ACRRX]MCG7405800.1 amino acid deaminase/aldolase [Paenibacillus sp. ACRRX]